MSRVARLVRGSNRLPWYFSIDASKYQDASKFTLSGAQIVSYTDSGFTLTSPSAPQRHLIDTVNTIGGKPVITLSATGNRRLFSQQGTALHGADHAIFTVERHRAALNGAFAFGTSFMLGQLLGGGHLFGSSVLGENSSDEFFGGGYGNLTPVCPVVTGPIVRAKASIGGKTYMITDGTPVLVNGLLAQGTPIDYDLAPGVGVGEFTDASNGATETDLAFGGILVDNISLRRVQLYVGRLAVLWGLPTREVRVEAYGDSLTFGSIDLSQSPNNYPATLQAALRTAGFTGAVVNNHGNPGWLSTELADATQRLQQVEAHWSPRYRDHWALVSCGTNDIKPPNNGSVAQVIGSLETIASGARAAGLRVAYVTIFPLSPDFGPLDPGMSAKYPLINQYMRDAAASGLVDGTVDLESDYNVATFGDLSLGVNHSDNTHGNDAGYEIEGNMIADFLIPRIAA